MATNDHRVEFYVDATTFIALKARSADECRTMSQHLRYLVIKDMEQALAEMTGNGRGETSGREGER